MNVLEVKGISKSFGDKKVVDNVSFQVNKGKIVGLLGKNGSFLTGLTYGNCRFIFRRIF
ncbi:MAG: hypothetical protein IJ938_05015 [Clostridia bacterium]|nr:hypothetical protein [Clostridia bacterium]